MASAVQVDQAAIERPGTKASGMISPEIKSWIDNLIVPGLVEEFLSKHTPRKTVAEKSGLVVTSRATAEGIQ